MRWTLGPRLLNGSATDGNGETMVCGSGFMCTDLERTLAPSTYKLLMMCEPHPVLASAMCLHSQRVEQQQSGTDAFMRSGRHL